MTREPARHWLAALILAALAAPAARGQSEADGLELFRSRVRPILVDKCLTCHAAEPSKGGLDLTRRASALAGGESGEAIIAGKPDESLLLDKVVAGEMPPKNPLKPEQVDAFKAWIAAGAPYEAEPLSARRAGPDWWSLRPIRRPERPAERPGQRSDNPIDTFILKRLDDADLEPAPEAARRALVRRVTFDLTGLPPSPEDVDAFVNDRRPDAYERLVDRLLASPRYGERWARHWLDVARFGESHGYEMNQLRPNAWPYRDWVIRAFNDDLPFAQFVREQLAGDAVGGDWLAQSATGFLVGGAHDMVGNATVEGMRQQRADDLDDILTATSTAFLGLTVNCARCHDHKFDPIKQSDYYGLQAALAGTVHAERELPPPDAERRQRERAEVAAELARLDRALDDLEPIVTDGSSGATRPPVNARRNVERFAPTPARFIRFTAQATSDNLQPCIDELEAFSAGEPARNVAADSAAVTASSEYPNAEIHKIVHVNDGRFGNGRSWISAEPGRGWITIELKETATIDRIAWGRDREEKYRDRLATDYRIEVATEPDHWQLVASSADRRPLGSADAGTEENPERASIRSRRDELAARLAALSPLMKVYAGTFSQPGPTHLLRRGDPMQPGEPVAPSGLSAVRPPLTLPVDAPERDRRLALADWIAHPDNPLPARVMVNRLWHYHFGRGIVATPSDFGFQGGPPSHPELLDWLAAEFLAGGGRLKPIHRLIVTSAAYRRSDRPDPRAEAIDKANVLLWRSTPRRLEAEAIRDAILAVAGNLDGRMGGPGYSLWEKNTNYVMVFTPLPDLGPDTFRRMVYQFKPRSQPDPTFGAFDCPDAALVAPRRNASTTALQALNLLNSRFLVDQSRRFAARLLRDAGPDPAAQARLGFRLALGREPTGAEELAASALIRDHGAAAFCRALYNANEFVYIP